jgi:hypothetical protein
MLHDLSKALRAAVSDGLGQRVSFFNLLQTAGQKQWEIPLIRRNMKNIPFNGIIKAIKFQSIPAR